MVARRIDDGGTGLRYQVDENPPADLMPGPGLEVAIVAFRGEKRKRSA